MPTGPAYRPWRRFLRLSVRGLIVVVLGVGAGLGWAVSNAHVQRDAVAAITNAKGTVAYDWEWSNGKIIPAGEPWAPRSVVDHIGVDYFGHVTRVTHTLPWMEFDPVIINAGRLPQLERLDLNGKAFDSWGLFHSIPARRLSGQEFRASAATGAGLIHLKGLVKLTELSIRCSQLNDAGLVHLKGLTSLMHLDLANTPVSDIGLAHLNGLTKLSRLDIGYTSVTDAGLVHLKPLTNLLELDLTYTAVTDAGLVHLQGLKKLSELGLLGTRVTEAGMKELRQALPTLTISR